MCSKNVPLIIFDSWNTETQNRREHLPYRLAVFFPEGIIFSMKRKWKVRSNIKNVYMSKENWKQKENQISMYILNEWGLYIILYKDLLMISNPSYFERCFIWTLNLAYRYQMSFYIVQLHTILVRFVVRDFILSLSVNKFITFCQLDIWRT